MEIETKLIHEGEMIPLVERAINLPIFQSSTYKIERGESYEKARYARGNNTPNHLVLAKKIASLENGESSVVTSSGMAAICAAVLTHCRGGDHLLTQANLYGGTHTLVKSELPRLDISHTMVDLQDSSGWKKALTPKTKLFYVESISNPALMVPDFEQVISFCREHGLVSVIDNTIATPFNFCPADVGFDISIHSATKYLNGHSDIIAGCLISSHKHIEKAMHHLAYFGPCLDPFGCFLLQRGMRTFAIRMQAHNQNAIALATWLEKHPKVKKVWYPGLESHPSYANAKKYFSRGYGGMVSLELEGAPDNSNLLMDHLRFPIEAPSMGGVESLISRPSTYSHSALSPEDQLSAGVTPGMIRFSCGIENINDLTADFEQALDKIRI
jgi:cystathionine beta-lyase/cystathionine gamma-synthase